MPRRIDEFTFRATPRTDGYPVYRQVGDVTEHIGDATLHTFTFTVTINGRDHTYHRFLPQDDTASMLDYLMEQAKRALIEALKGEDNATV